MPLSRNVSRRLCLGTQAFLIAIQIALFVPGSHSFAVVPSGDQQSFPSPPADHALIYVANASNALEPLPFETGSTPLKTDAVAANNRTSYIEVKGPSAEKSIEDTLARFYLFTVDEANVHPPFIVHLTIKHGARRVTVMAQKGLKGFAIFSEEIIKPHYRVLSRAGGTLYMEISPRESLAPGEYAIIGADLNRIATFRIATTANR